MIQLYNDLNLTKSDFYRMLDSDLEFANAVKCGFSDSRSERLLELESRLINLALGTETEEIKTLDDGNGGILTTTLRKKYPPNLSALQLLLERYEGSKWTLQKNVTLDTGTTPQEIDYKMLNKSQLKKLAVGVKPLDYIEGE